MEAEDARRQRLKQLKPGQQVIDQQHHQHLHSSAAAVVTTSATVSASTRSTVSTSTVMKTETSVAHATTASTTTNAATVKRELDDDDDYANVDTYDTDFGYASAAAFNDADDEDFADTRVEPQLVKRRAVADGATATTRRSVTPPIDEFADESKVGEKRQPAAQRSEKPLINLIDDDE
jgi:hypothetical protein